MQLRIHYERPTGMSFTRVRTSTGTGTCIIVNVA